MIMLTVMPMVMVVVMLMAMLMVMLMARIMVMLYGPLCPSLSPAHDFTANVCLWSHIPRHAMIRDSH